MGMELARQLAGNLGLSNGMQTGKTRREIARVEAGTDIAIAFEDARTAVIRARLGNAADLTEYAAMRLTALHLLITQVAHERPQLEMELRQLQSLLAMGSGQAIYEYLNR